MAGPVKISFLDNSVAISSTAKFLISKGYDHESVNLFCKVLNHYNSTPSDLDFNSFPKAEAGFYSFRSMTNLTALLRRPLIYVKHEPELNCFDFTSLLTAASIKFKIKTNELAGPFLVPYGTTNGDVKMEVASTSDEAFKMICPSWWAQVSGAVFSGRLQAQRMDFLAAFNSFNFIPSTTSRENLPKVLLKSLKLTWNRCGISFPKQSKIVIFHSFWPQGRNALSTHSGLLFENDRQYVFLEKDGATGPYVRLDFENLNDLFIWYMAAIKPLADRGNITFATFNDEVIYQMN